MKRLVSADGMEARIGIQSGKARYPKHGRTQVAKVAGVHGVTKILGSELDRMRAQVNAGIAAVHDKVAKGMTPQAAILEVAVPYRDAIRARIREELHDTGLLERNIGAAVYAGKGGAKKRVAGDPYEGSA
jgi:hypothetical protein